MLGLLDCAVLLRAEKEDWLDEWLRRNAAATPRVRLHPHALTPGGEGAASVASLRDAGMSLRRYDAAILPVSYASLSWARTALACVGGLDSLPVPVMALVSGLRAPAIQDLLDLGIVDFLRDDACQDDLRIRLAQMANAQGLAACAGWESAFGEPVAPPPGPAARSRLRSGRPRLIGGVPAAPGHAAGAEPALPVSPQLREPELAFPVRRVARAELDGAFRAAKSRVVDSFEKAYIDKVLSRHAGNISMAARSAQKHRRAFWALMRKHRIDAAPYRVAARAGKEPAPD